MTTKATIIPTANPMAPLDTPVFTTPVEGDRAPTNQRGGGGRRGGDGFLRADKIADVNRSYDEYRSAQWNMQKD